jgi:hypothetical protein
VSTDRVLRNNIKIENFDNEVGVLSKQLSEMELYRSGLSKVPSEMELYRSGSSVIFKIEKF